MGCQNYILTIPSNHQAPLVGLTVSRPNPSRATLHNHHLYFHTMAVMPHSFLQNRIVAHSLPGTARPDLSAVGRTSTQLHDCLVSTDLSFSLHSSVKRGVPSCRKLTLYLYSGGPSPSRPHPINLPTSPRFPNVFNLFLFSLLPSKHAQLSHPSQVNTKPTLTPCSLVTYPALSPTSKLNFLKPFALPVSTSALCVHHFMKLISSLSEKH